MSYRSEGYILQSSICTPHSKSWSARQDLHLRSLGPKPRMLLLHHALIAPTAVSSRQEKRGTPNPGNSPAVRPFKFEIQVPHSRLLTLHSNGAPGGTCTHTLPADNGLLFYSATGATQLQNSEFKLQNEFVRKSAICILQLNWWEALVMLQSSLPT